ncbi:hypothetical protein ACX0G9_07075 [Flavitalea flava]
MKDMYILTLIFVVSLFVACKGKETGPIPATVIGHGQMPAIVTDGSHTIHLVYGKGDSILYMYSTDKGRTFSDPLLVDTMGKLYAFSMRGPQIALTDQGVAIVAVNQQGNIFSYVKEASGKWAQTARLNDADSVAKEGFLGVCGDGKNNLFAIWLDLRADKHNKIYGSRSMDGGKTWSKNTMIYTSPDGTVCECCKPSVAMHGNNVYVMFRNWLKGNRDLYLLQSTDGGNTFNQAQELGNGHWQLNGCPMDGGGLAINDKGTPQTIWRRKGMLYTCEPGKDETEIAEGKSCSMETIKGKNIYTWTDKGNVICLLPDGKKLVIGQGNLPIVKAINEEEAICIWEQDTEIKRSILHL